MRRHNWLLVSVWLLLAQAPLTAIWQADVLHITIANPAPNRCLMLIGGGKLDVYLPDSCGVTTYDLPIVGIDSNYAPVGRTLRLVDSGSVVYDLPISPRSVLYLPLVVTP